MKNRSFLVLGSSGNVGSEIAQNLHAQGFKVRGTTSQKNQPAQKNEGIETVFVNLETGEGLHQAFRNIDRAFFLSPAGLDDQYKLLSSLIKAAKDEGLKKIVLMTAIGVNHNPESPFRKAEIDLENSGIAFNIIRPNWFMQNFNSFWVSDILNKNKILLPAAQEKVSFIDTRDISAVIAKLLVNDDKNNMAFDLTGSEALDHNEVAEIISKVTNKKISYEEITPSELKNKLLQAKINDNYANLMVSLFEYIRNGHYAAITNSIKEILGREPITMKQYAEDYKNNWV